MTELSDTPETDNLARGNHVVPTDWAEQLERERDEARSTLTDIYRWIDRNHPDGFIDSLSYSQNLERVADNWHDRFDIVERERDEERKIAEKLRKERFEARKFALALHEENVKLKTERDEWAKLCGQYKQERDEARHEIKGWRNKWECAVEMAARAEVERDEARATK